MTRIELWNHTDVAGSCIGKSLIYLSGLSCTLNKIKILDSHINYHIGLICYLINSTLANYFFFSVIYKVLRNRLVLIFVFAFFFILKIIINN